MRSGGLTAEASGGLPGGAEEERRQRPQPPERGRSTRRTSAFREGLDVPCFRRIKTNDGRRDSRVASGELVPPYSRFTTLTQKSILSGEAQSIAQAFFLALDPKDQWEVVADLNNEMVDAQRMLDVFMQHLTLGKLESLNNLLRMCRKAIGAERTRLIEVGANGDGTNLLDMTKVTDTGFAQQCLEAKETLVINDMDSQLSDVMPDNVEKEAQSLLSLPLDLPAHLLPVNAQGVALQVFNRRGETGRGGSGAMFGFSSEDLKRGKMLAALVGIVVRNVYNRRFLRLQRENQSRLLEAATAICSEMDGPKLAENLIRLLHRLVPCAQITLYLSDLRKKELYSVFTTSKDTESMRESFRFGEGIPGWVATSNKVANVLDAYEDPRFDPQHEAKTARVTRSVLAIPVVLDSQIMGVIYLVNKFADVGDPVLPNRERPQPRKYDRMSGTLLERNSTRSMRGRVRRGTERQSAANESRRRSVGEVNIGAPSVQEEAKEEGQDADSAAEEGDLLPLRGTRRSRRGSSTEIQLERSPTDRSEPTPRSKLLLVNDSRSQTGILRQRSRPSLGSVVRGSLDTSMPGGSDTASKAGGRGAYQSFKPQRSVNRKTLDKISAQSTCSFTLLTYFTDFHAKVGGLIASRISHAIRVQQVRYQYDKAIADNGDHAGALRSLLFAQDNQEPREEVASLIRGHKTTFRAIGKFLTIVRASRERKPGEKSPVARPARRGTCTSLVDEATEKVLKRKRDRLISRLALPETAMFSSLAGVFQQLHVEAFDASFADWHYDLLADEPEALEAKVCFAFLHLGLVDKFRIDEVVLGDFVQAVREGYLDNPYHNWHHAVSVFQQVYAIIVNTKGAEFMHFQDVFALALASLCHDIGHRGRTNDFESKSLSDLAICYNDNSVLEQYHASVTFRILSKPETDVLEGVSKPKYRELRRLIIKHIIATDMKHHASQLVNMKAQIMEAERCGGAPVQREVPESREAFSSFLLHACDIGAQTYPAKIAVKWAEMVLSEFSAQAADEDRLGLAPTPYMQNLSDKATVANVQHGFISYLVEPAWETMALILPSCAFMLHNIQTNKAAYEQNMATTSNGAADAGSAGDSGVAVEEEGEEEEEEEVAHVDDHRLEEDDESDDSNDSDESDEDGHFVIAQHNSNDHDLGAAIDEE